MCDNTDRPRGRDAEGSEVRQRKINTDDFTDIWNLKNRIKQTKQNRNQLTDTEN